MCLQSTGQDNVLGNIKTFKNNHLEFLELPVYGNHVSRKRQIHHRLASNSQNVSPTTVASANRMIYNRLH